MLRKFKFSLSRHNLEAIYFTYILPLLEYACELWDGCTQQEYKERAKTGWLRIRIMCRSEVTCLSADLFP
jgi:hypothetical protein